MKREYSMTQNLAVIGMTSSKNRLYSVKADTSLTRVPVCDEATLTRLNLLVKTFPFCAWHKQKDNDPL
jgi:hypothetical protein